MIQKSNGLSTKSNEEPGQKYTCKSSATTLKIEIDSLIEKLNETVCHSNKYKVVKVYVFLYIFYFFKEAHFIRCILPNDTKQRGKFDEGLVLKQLITSNSIAFAKFMRYGYSEHVLMEKMIDVFKSVENKFSKWSINRPNFYSKVLLSLGFQLEDFKIGKDSIFFRTNKIRLLEKCFCDIEAKSFSNEQLLIPEQEPRPK